MGLEEHVCTVYKHVRFVEGEQELGSEIKNSNGVGFLADQIA